MIKILKEKNIAIIIIQVIIQNFGQMKKLKK